VAVRHFPLLNFFMAEKYMEGYWENKRYGELYYFNMIDNFKEYNLPPYRIKYRFSKDMPSMHESDILIFGDSFFDFSRMPTFPERLGWELNKKVYYERYDVPLKSLAQKEYKNKEPKFLIFETSERYVHTRFANTHRYYEIWRDRSYFGQLYDKTLRIAFNPHSEKMYNYMLYQSYITKPVYSAIATFKFNTFGYIPRSTPMYTFHNGQPWLFLGESVEKTNKETSFYHQFQPEDIDLYCDNIADLAGKLREHYNLHLIFIVLPTKYTVYHKLLNNHKYHNLIPSLYKELEERNIPVVKVFDEYMNSDELIFYPTDTHWTPTGLEIALKKTLEVIDSVKMVRKIP
jgi:hypothetical protein